MLKGLKPVRLPCGLYGYNISCFKDCDQGRTGNIKKIELCYSLLKSRKGDAKHARRAKNK